MAGPPHLESDFMSVEALKELWDQNKIKINDQYQRSYIWKPQQKRDLIDSILKGFSTGVLVVWMNKEDQMEILDGQQRVKTFVGFLNNKFENNNEQKFNKLSTTDQSEIKGYRVYYLKLKSHLNDEEISDIFTRLQEGTPLNIAEKVNAFHGAFRNGFMDGFNKNYLQLFSRVRNYRFRGRFLSAQFLLLELESDFDRVIFPNMRYRDFKDVNGKYKNSLPQDKSQNCHKVMEFLGKCIHNQLESIQPRDIISIYLLVSYLQKKIKDTINLETNIQKFVSEFSNTLNKFSIYDINPPSGMDVDTFAKYKDYKEQGRKATSSDSIEKRFTFILSEYKNMFPNEPVKEEIVSAVSNINPYDILKDLETKLRDFIQNELKKIDHKWWQNKIPIDVKDEAERRQKEDEKIWPWQEEKKLDPIHYVNFSEYAKIIRKRDNWRLVFKKMFVDEEIVASKLKELEPIRNDIMHSRTLTKNQSARLKILTEDITKCLKFQIVSET